MIRVTVDVVGRTHTLLGELRIVNDGHGSPDRADYRVSFRATSDRTERVAWVRDYARARGAFELVERALQALRDAGKGV